MNLINVFRDRYSTHTNKEDLLVIKLLDKITKNKDKFCIHKVYSILPYICIKEIVCINKNIHILFQRKDYTLEADIGNIHYTTYKLNVIKRFDSVFDELDKYSELNKNIVINDIINKIGD